MLSKLVRLTEPLRGITNVTEHLPKKELYFVALHILTKLFDRLEAERRTTMPKRQESSAPAVQFADVPLTKNDKKKVMELAEEPVRLLGMLITAIDQGYRVSVAPDIKNVCFMSTMKSIDASDNKNFIMMTRGSEPMKVLAATMYKHHVKREGGQWQEPMSEDDDWFE